MGECYYFFFFVFDFGILFKIVFVVGVCFGLDVFDFFIGDMYFYGYVGGGWVVEVDLYIFDDWVEVLGVEWWYVDYVVG